MRGRPNFITLHGIAAFLCGSALAVSCTAIAGWQVFATIRNRAYLPRLPPALASSAVGVLTGLFLALGAEFGWLSGSLLDDLALPLSLAASGWMYFNRMGVKHDRRAARLT